jgi:putative addiction module CopG family antidote
MSLDPSLSPDLQRFIENQIASGRFQSEDDVVRAALQLLASRLTPVANIPTSKSEANTESAASAALPLAFGQKYRPFESSRAGSITESRETADPPSRRSPRGLLADLLNKLGPEDFREARSEAWVHLAGREAE